jgi:hypothetical protein
MQKILVDSGQLGFQNFVQNGNLAQAKDIAAGTATCRILFEFRETTVIRLAFEIYCRAIRP